MRLRVLAAVVVPLIGGPLVYALASPTANAQHPTLNHMSSLQKRILSGFLSYELDLSVQSSAHTLSNYQPRSNAECPINRGSNIKVNQNCLNVSDPDLQGRGQAENEPAIAADPNHPDHLVASANDYVRGDGTCGSYWSSDGGRTWNDGTLPNGFVRGPQFGAGRQYFQACGDTSVAWDSKGNAYELAMMFMRGTTTTNNHDFSSGIYVFRSTGNHGASWNFPGRPVAELANFTGTASLDKPYMTVDNWPSSRFQDRVYATWTLFDPDGTVYLYGAYSSDYGQTFSGPVLVSTDSTLCDKTYGLPTPHGACNVNQYSQPFTGPDGMLYVVYQNYNKATTGNDNRRQMLLVKSTDGGRSFGAPVKVADYYDLPDCFTYQGQDPGRACVPEKGPSKNSFFRATNYPSGAVDPNHPNHIVVTFGSYINSHSNERNGCIPAGVSAASGQNLYTGVKQPGACNNDIVLSVSKDSGRGFTGTTTDPRELPSVTSAPGQTTTDQWFQWAAFTKSGRLAVSYYDRQYGNDELTGYSDFSLSGSVDLNTFGVQRVSSAAMPPPTQFDGLFWGDYTGLTAVHRAHPIWSDTRDLDVFVCQDASGKVILPPSVCVARATNASLANDQNIYTAGLGVPVR